MANIKNSKIIRLFTIRPYGYGVTNYRNEKMVSYTDYLLGDLAVMIIEQKKEKDLEILIDKLKAN